VTFLSLARLRGKKKILFAFLQTFGVPRWTDDTDEWTSDFFVVRIKRIRNDERLIFDGVETFSFALKKDSREYHAHTKNALSLELFCALSVRE
jgi:hypothetical protein